MTGGVFGLISRYRMRLKRRRLLWRSIRSRRQLTPINVRTNLIQRDQVLAFVVLRNEMQRLPFFLTHYRRLGVGHFLIVANDCTDGSAEFLAEQPDVSLWRADASYKSARFGVDWLTWLQFRYGHGHWCLSVDVDELLIYPHHDQRPLPVLTQRLEATGAEAMGALMLDLYPKGPLGSGTVSADDNPIDALPWFDTGPYRTVRQAPMQNLWLQGGARERVFFADNPTRGPTLNKLPLVKWSRRYAYANSTHSILPPGLNLEWDGPPAISGTDQLSGVLLHTKFLPGVLDRSEEEKARREHFGQPDQFDAYYDAIGAAPDLWHPGAQRFEDWQQLTRLGLMSAGGWT